MNGFWWLLRPEEREVVRGDLAESGESGLAALAQIAGLAARRTWRPVCTLLLAAGMGWWLVRESDRLIGAGATYLWMYLGNWRAADMANSGFWREMALEYSRLILPCLLLMAGSLVAGTIASRARRGAADMFCMVLAAATLADVVREPFFAYALAFWAAVVLVPAILSMRLIRHHLP
ncbi:MAG TPA: hypothetical protein VMB03_28840 [Bryobacteraceae bacterium]|nr:hypothetical protein [Bryobacteraceae bacterium]